MPPETVSVPRGTVSVSSETLPEAGLFAVAEAVLVEVLGRIRPADLDIVLPAQRDLPGPPVDTPLGEVVEQYRADAAGVAAVIATEDGDGRVQAPYGLVPVRTHLLRLAVTRSLLAHYVAAYLGSTACPLPEELARPLWELTAPHAEVWRSWGIFRAPLPVPHLASWRDTFLLTAGHLPHPLGH